MGKLEKLITKLLSGSADNNFRFEDLRSVLLSLGFTEKTTAGSHRIFYMANVLEIVNIQPDGNKAKPYQVKQVRSIILKYSLVSYE
ncbi:type II toxin-antitoxin system HicA family toxin [Dyadobacter sp. CY323]|uniref:type II toxin-antitoxin system HicA family toxin n=1 Tax=Dyadobacter sp. CY323 TaxID=2907302 RepID=UPI001F304BAB|nr:type II toxin-antitoxin system HicA family toxin [Dyadobacter sp. CY323]MCE6989281.1 type II toxin-antitoxin system HicA family toxin [Dyadobacter sp. CY323]